MTEAKKVPFHTDFIKLDSFLKLSSACDTGGEAKMMVQDGEVLVNGEVCMERGRKIREGDQVAYDGLKYIAVKK